VDFFGGFGRVMIDIMLYGSNAERQANAGGHGLAEYGVWLGG